MVTRNYRSTEWINISRSGPYIRNKGYKPEHGRRRMAESFILPLKSSLRIRYLIKIKLRRVKINDGNILVGSDGIEYIAIHVWTSIDLNSSLRSFKKEKILTKISTFTNNNIRSLSINPRAWFRVTLYTRNCLALISKRSVKAYYEWTLNTVIFVRISRLKDNLLHLINLTKSILYFASNLIYIYNLSNISNLIPSLSQSYI